MMEDMVQMVGMKVMEKHMVGLRMDMALALVAMEEVMPVDMRLLTLQLMGKIK